MGDPHQRLAVEGSLKCPLSGREGLLAEANAPSPFGAESPVRPSSAPLAKAV
jgi:hypothetical protein